MIAGPIRSHDGAFFQPTSLLHDKHYYRRLILPNLTSLSDQFNKFRYQVNRSGLIFSSF